MAFRLCSFAVLTSLFSVPRFLCIMNSISPNRCLASVQSWYSFLGVKGGVKLSCDRISTTVIYLQVTCVRNQVGLDVRQEASSLTVYLYCSIFIWLSVSDNPYLRRKIIMSFSYDTAHLIMLALLLSYQCVIYLIANS